MDYNDLKEGAEVREKTERLRRLNIVGMKETLSDGSTLEYRGGPFASVAWRPSDQRQHEQGEVRQVDARAPR